MSLFEAIAAKNLEALVKALPSNDVNEVGDGKTTPLIEAAKTGFLEGVKRLLAAGAEPDWRDDQQETALLKAAANGHAQVAAVLMPHASDDDRDMAKQFLAAFGASHAPEFQYETSPLHRSLVEKAARAANFVGHEEPLKRIERQERAEAEQKKKR